MSLFDSVNHTFTALSTGGPSGEGRVELRLGPAPQILAFGREFLRQFLPLHLEPLFQVEDDQTWHDVKQGKKLAFSIQGKAVRKEL